MKIRYRTHQLKFRHPFTISKGTKTHQPTLIVELEFNGIRGFGEAPAIAYYNIPVEKMVEDIEAKKPFIEKFAYTDPERYWHYLHHLFPNNSFLVCALDMASWDIYGKLLSKPLFRIWNTDLADAPLTDYTIGIDSIPNMIEKIKERPWPVYKIKLGTSDDLTLMNTLRQHTDSLFRVDANAAWNLEQAMNLLPALKALGVELVEQPLAEDDWEGMKILHEHSPLSLIADESCVGEGDLEKCLNHFHGINIKLTKCGGITPAIRMIQKARQNGLKIMLGCMNESSIGTAAMVQLSPLVDFLDADGPMLLEEDLATGLRYEKGRILAGQNPGLGVFLKEHAI